MSNVKKTHGTPPQPRRIWVTHTAFLFGAQKNCKGSFQELRHQEQHWHTLVLKWSKPKPYGVGGVSGSVGLVGLPQVTWEQPERSGKFWGLENWKLAGFFSSQWCWTELSWLMLVFCSTQTWGKCCYHFVFIFCIVLFHSEICKMQSELQYGNENAAVGMLMYILLVYYCTWVFPK